MGIHNTMIDNNLEQNKVLNLKIDTSITIPEATITQPASSGAGKTIVFEYIPDLLSYLEKLGEKTKVRVIFKDYTTWREFLPYSTIFKKKFASYKEKREFILDLVASPNKAENASLKESLIKYLDASKTPEEIRKILLGELK